MRATADRPAPPGADVRPGPTAAAVADPLRSILRNSSLLIGAQIIASIMAMGLMVLLSRALGSAEFGRLHLALSLTMIVGVAVEFGLTQVLARTVARQRALARPYLRRALVVILALGGLGYVTLLGLVDRLGYPEEIHRLVAILGVIMVAEATAQVLGAVFQAHEEMRVPALARVAGNAATLALVGPVLLRGHGAPTVAAMLALAAVVRVVIQATAVGRLSGMRGPAGPAPSWAGLLRAGLPFLVAQGLGMVIFRVDVVMLGRMTSDATVGWYGVASRLMEAFNFLPQLLTAATFPVAARLWVTSRAEFRATVRKTLHVLLVVTVPVAVMLLVLAEEIVGLLFTLEAYGPSVPVLRVHALSLGLVFVDFYLVGIMMAIGRERIWIAIAAAACLLNPALNWLLIPPTDGRWGNGGIGAALATLLTELFILGVAVRGVPKGTFGRETGRVAGRAAAVGVLLGGFLLGGRAAGAPWLVTAMLGGLGYLALVIRLGILPRDVLGWARGLVSRRRPRPRPPVSSAAA